MDILIFSEKDEVAFELLSWAKKAALGKVIGLALGNGAQQKAAAYRDYGADKVLWSENALLKDFHADVYPSAVLQAAAAANPGLVLIGSTRRGKELAPRLAQKWGGACITDAMAITVKDGDINVKRYTLGGNTVSTEVMTNAKKVVSVLPKSFEVTKAAGAGEAAELPLTLKAPRIKLVERKAKEGETVSLEEAQALVCVGRGLNKKDDMPMIEALAKAINAEIGCTRPLSHDLQWLSEEREVGLSGKKCKPVVNVSVGISGQIQHVVGIRDSKVIVAINKDKTAPIFEMTDYGIVGDIYDVVPLLTEKIKKL
jgi:electron transfer flavoprotein alpha subunit